MSRDTWALNSSRTSVNTDMSAVTMTSWKKSGC